VTNGTLAVTIGGGASPGRIDYIEKQASGGLRPFPVYVISAKF
jgi:hypothetical protein